MVKVKKSKSKDLQNKAQNSVNTKNTVFIFNIMIPIAIGNLKSSIAAIIIGLGSLAMSSCNNIEQPSATHIVEKTQINITAVNSNKVGVNIK